jgi:hypothetical protein
MINIKGPTKRSAKMHIDSILGGGEHLYEFIFMLQIHKPSRLFRCQQVIKLGCVAGKILLFAPCERVNV